MASIAFVGNKSIGGSNTQVQFNDSGSLAGDADLTFDKTTGALTVGGSAYLKNVKEVFSTKSSTGATQTYDCSTGHIFYQTSMDQSFTANFTNLSMASGYATSVTLVLSQSATAYIPTAIQVGGVGQQLDWLGGSPPTGNSNKKDVVSFSILNVSSSYVVLGQLATFG